jgi:cytochrome c-type biogenesis protein CcmE
MKTKLWIIGAIILIPIVAHIIYAIAVSPTMNYYLTVDEFLARSANPPTRVGGAIVPGSIKWDNATQTMRFQIAGSGSAIIAIAYRGRVPDAFRDGVTAIVEGARASDGGFAATTLMIKCPHQYLPAGF